MHKINVASSLKSQIAVFSMPCLISGINFVLHFVNQFYLFMLTAVRLSFLHFLHPSPFHSFTKLKTYLFGKSFPPQTFYHRLFRLTSSANKTVSCSYCVCRFQTFSFCFWRGRQNQVSSFSAHGKIGNFNIIKYIRGEKALSSCHLSQHTYSSVVFQCARLENVDL